MRKYRILNIIDKSIFGGGQQFVYITVSHLDEMKFVKIVCCSPGGPLIERCRDRGLDVRTIPMDKKFSPMSMFKLFRLIKKENIDLIHSHGLLATVFATVVAKIKQVPIIYSQHGFHHYYYNGKLRRFLRIETEKYFIRQVKVTICDSMADQNKGVRERYFSYNNSLTLYPPLNLSEFNIGEEEKSSLIKELELGEETPVIGTVGRLDKAKGYTYMLEAISRVSKIFPDLHFFFIGEGEERGKLEALTEKLNLNKNVMFLGRQPDIKPFLLLFNVFISSSLWEGLPFAICEAMAMGKPVVATDAGGCPEVVKNGVTGLIVPTKDPEALARAIAELLHDKERRKNMGVAARRRIEELFDVKVIIGNLERIYRDILEKQI